MIDGRNGHRERLNGPTEKRQFVIMLHRAEMQRDSSARQWLQRAMRKPLLEYLHRHPFYANLHRIASDERYMTATFERFWQRVDQQKLHVDSRPTLVRYTQATLNGLILETLRLAVSQQETPVAAQPSPRGPALWSVIQQVLPDERERRVAYLLYHCGLKPAEIVRTCPQEFADVQEIHRLRCVVIEKMRVYL